MPITSNILRPISATLQRPKYIATVIGYKLTRYIALITRLNDLIELFDKHY